MALAKSKDTAAKPNPKLLGIMPVGLPGSINEGRYLAFSPNGKLLVSVRPANIGGTGDNNEIKLFNVAQAKQIAEFKIEAKFSPKVEHVGFSPDGGKLLVSCNDGVRLWDVSKWNSAKKAKPVSRRPPIKREVVAEPSAGAIRRAFLVCGALTKEGKAMNGILESRVR